MTDNVNRPSHYTGRNIGYECIDLARHQTFCVGNVIKYLWRHEFKGNPVEDLKKARWYAIKASITREPVDTEPEDCKAVLLKLISSTSGHESAAWKALMGSKWHVVLLELDTMIEGPEK
jgi:hypothetical protein